MTRKNKNNSIIESMNHWKCFHLHRHFCLLEIVSFLCRWFPENKGKRSGRWNSWTVVLLNINTGDIKCSMILTAKRGKLYNFILFHFNRSNCNNIGDLQIHIAHSLITRSVISHLTFSKLLNFHSFVMIKNKFWKGGVDSRIFAEHLGD